MDNSPSIMSNNSTQPGNFFEGLGLKRNYDGRVGHLGSQRPGKNIKAGSSLKANGAGKRSRFVGMPLREQWSAVENVILAEEEL